MHALTTRLKSAADEGAGDGGSAETQSGNGMSLDSACSSESVGCVSPVHLAVEASVGVASRLASAPFEASPSVSHPREESQWEGPVPEHDLAALLRAASQRAGAKGCSAIAEILSRAGILDGHAADDAASNKPEGCDDAGSGRREADRKAAGAEANAAKSCDPTPADAASTHSRWRNLQAMDSGQSAVVDEAGEMQPREQCMSPAASSDSPECSCMACTCTLMPTSPQPELPQSVNVQEIGLKFSVIFSWRFAMRENSVSRENSLASLLCVACMTEIVLMGRTNSRLISL